MLTEAEINEIEVKHISVTLAPSEITWEDEAWIIGHLKEIVISYRRDVPRLLADRNELLEAIEQRKSEITDLLKVCNSIRDLFGYDRDDGIDLVTCAAADYNALKTEHDDIRQALANLLPFLRDDFLTTNPNPRIGFHEVMMAARIVLKKETLGG